MKKVLPALFAVMVVTGCVHVSYTRTSPARYGPVAEGNVYVFQTLDQVPQPYESIGIVYTKTNSRFNHEGLAIDKAKKKAGMLGANGIVISPFVEPSAGAQIAGAVFGVHTFRKGEALAIRFDPANLQRVQQIAR